MKRPRTAVRAALIVMFGVVVGIGCATTPLVRVWQPWTRVVGDPAALPLGSKIKIDITGQTNPLLGAEDLAQKELKHRLSELLERRGYVIVEEAPQFRLVLSYRTERADKLRVTAGSATSYESVTETGAGAASATGQGVSIAKAVGVAAVHSRYGSSTAITAKAEASYTHILSMEVTGTGKDAPLVWKGESTWDSDNLDMISDAGPAFQVALARLPSNPAARPRILSVKEDHALNFYTVACRNRWFSSPALPYKARIGGDMEQAQGDRKLPKSVADPTALAACVDLLETAEYALPQGKKDWSKPLENSLWAKAELGQQYEMRGQNAKVLLTLSGSTNGYTVKKCWLASDAEYSEFESRMQAWKRTLAEYFNVFQR